MPMAMLRLVRWPNLVIIGFIFLLVKTQVVDVLHSVTLLSSCLTGLHWWLMALATVLIAASGNVVNDIFDQDIDAYNRPDDRTVGVSVSEEAAWNLYYVLSGAGLSAGILLAYLLGNVSNGLIFLLALGGLWFYSYSYKRQFLIGNLVVALLAGLVVYLPVFFEMMCNPHLWRQLPWMPFLMAYALFAVLSTLIREIIKDLEDMDGDRRMSCSTVPLVIGIKATKALVTLLTLTLIAAVARYQTVKWEANEMLSFIYLTAVVQLPALLMLSSLWKANDALGFRMASRLAKVMIIGGISSMLLFRFAV
jgi:4-hydroxybenzoate polyprenyltransferase